MLCDSTDCPIAADSASSQILCHCLNVTHEEVHTAIVALNIQTVKELSRCTGAGQGCMACRVRLKQMLSARTESLELAAK